MVLGNERKVQRPHFNYNFSINFFEIECALFGSRQSYDVLMRSFRPLPIEQITKDFCASFSFLAFADLYPPCLDSRQCTG